VGTFLEKRGSAEGFLLQFFWAASIPPGKKIWGKKTSHHPFLFFARHVFTMERRVINDLLESVFFVDFAMAPD